MTPGQDDYVFCKPAAIYVIYLKNGGTAELHLSDGKGNFEVKWYDPRHGGSLLTGTVRSIPGGGIRSLGEPPSHADQDWTVLVRPSDPDR